MELYTQTERIILVVIVILYFAFMIIQGYWIGRKAKNTEDYVIAGRSIGVFPLILTMVGTATGGSALLGFTTQGYQSGISSMWGMAPAWIILIIMNLIVIKPIRNVGTRYKMQTIPDFMAVRFGEAARLPASISILLAYAAITGMQFTAIAGFLNITMNVPLPVGTLIGFLLLTLKSYTGGLKSVIWSDVIQGTIQTLGIVALVFISLGAAGGWGNVVSNAVAAGKPQYVNPFSMNIGQVLVYTFTIGAYQFMRQDIWQRIWAGKTGKTAFLSTWVSTIIAILGGIAIVVVGTVVGMGTGIKVAKPAQFYYYAVDGLVSFPIGVLLIIALVATIVSCGDSFLICGASTLSNDIFKKIMKITDDKKMLLMSRTSVWGISIIGLIGALAIPNLVVLWTTGTAMLTAGMLVPVLAGFYWKKANNKGGLYSCWGGVVLSVAWTLLGSPLGIHPVFIGTGLSLIFMLILSFTSEPSPKDVIENCYFRNNNSLADAIDKAST